MNWDRIIDQLGGGPGAVALVGLAFAWWSERQRNDRMVDTILTLSREQTVALNALTNAIERSERTK